MTNISTELKEGMVKDWSRYAPYFLPSEFVCSHTGLNYMQESFMHKLLILRLLRNHPMIVSSGYRHHTHPIEARKQEAGEHSRGIAADIKCWSDSAFDIAADAFKVGFTGVGVSQTPRSSARFLHLDTRTTTPRLYSY